MADFGFSCLLKGKDGTGVLHTKLGTEGYMAPEIPTKNYDGAKCDIFASGVILFIMYAGNPPFEKAVPNDPYYKLLKDKKLILFGKLTQEEDQLTILVNNLKTFSAKWLLTILLKDQKFKKSLHILGLRVQYVLTVK